MMEEVSVFKDDGGNKILIKNGHIIDILNEEASEHYQSHRESILDLPHSQREEVASIYLKSLTFAGTFDSLKDKKPKQLSGLIAVKIQRLSDTEIKAVQSELIARQSYIVAFYPDYMEDGFIVIMRGSKKKVPYEDKVFAAWSWFNENLNLYDDQFDDSAASITFVDYLPEMLNYNVNPTYKQTKDIGSVKEIDYDYWIDYSQQALKQKQDATKLLTDVSNSKDLYLPISALDFKHKSEHSNYLSILRHVQVSYGLYEIQNKKEFIYNVIVVCNKFGMIQRITKQFTVNYFSYHSITLQDPRLYYNEIEKMVDNIYEENDHDFGSLKPDDYFNNSKTPQLPDTVFEKLPDLLKSICSKFDGNEKNILFLGSLGLLSTCIPRMQGLYNNRYHGANIYVFISGPASGGKGALLWVRVLAKKFSEELKKEFEKALEIYDEEVKEYDNQDKQDDSFLKPIKPGKPKLIIGANTSASAIIQWLATNRFFGLLLETESDTLTYVLGNDWGNLSDTLRKAWHHEPISLLRRKDNEDLELERPNLSVVLSGTPAQLNLLLKSIENGLMSRLLLFSFDQNFQWIDVFKNSENSYDEFFEQQSEKIYLLCKPFFEEVNKERSNLIEFRFTLDQNKKFNKWFEEKSYQLHPIFGDDLVPSIKRLGVCFFRIAMILSTIRYAERMQQYGVKEFDPKIECQDIDFENTVDIIQTLLFHTVKVFKDIHKGSRKSIGLHIKDQYFDHLPDSFNRDVAMDTASFIELKDKTAEKYLSDFIKAGKLYKPQHNHYQKKSQ